MEKDIKERSAEENGANEEKSPDRRGFLLGLKKWSKIVIGGALLGSALWNAGAAKEAEAAGWANRSGGGGAWANRSGGGGAWANRGGGGAWANHTGGGGAWINHGGGAWANHGAVWANRGGSWVNRF